MNLVALRKKEAQNHTSCCKVCPHGNATRGHLQSYDQSQTAANRMDWRQENNKGPTFNSIEAFLTLPMLQMALGLRNIFCDCTPPKAGGPAVPPKEAETCLKLQSCRLCVLGVVGTRARPTKSKKIMASYTKTKVLWVILGLLFFMGNIVGLLWRSRKRLSTTGPRDHLSLRSERFWNYARLPSESRMPTAGESRIAQSFRSVPAPEAN